MSAKVQCASTAHRGIRTYIRVVFDNTMMPQHCSRTKAGKPSNPGFRLNRRARCNEGPYSDLNVGGHHRARMNDRGPPLVRNPKALDAVHSRLHVLNLLHRGYKHDVAVERVPVFEATEDRNTLQYLPRWQDVIKKAVQFDIRAGRRRTENCFSNDETVSWSAQYDKALSGHIFYTLALKYQVCRLPTSTYFISADRFATTKNLGCHPPNPFWTQAIYRNALHYDTEIHFRQLPQDAC
jgi:hypothetical protein